MRSSGIVIALLVALAVTSAPAGATTWGPPIVVPSANEVFPAAAVSDGRGNAITVSGNYDARVLQIDSIFAGRPSGQAALRGWRLLDVATGPGGMTLLIVKFRQNAADRLALVDVPVGARRVDARIRWSTRVPFVDAGAVVRTSTGVAVAWIAQSESLAPSRPSVRTAILNRAWRDGSVRTFGDAQRLPDGRRALFPATLDLAVDGRGRVVLAVSAGRWISTDGPTSRRDGWVLVADASRRGAFLLGQRLHDGEGIPELLRGPTGRLALLVHDDGFSPTDHECYPTGTRSIWATVRGPRSRTFPSPRRLLRDGPSAVCGPGVDLDAAPDGRFAVVWGAGDFGDPSGARIRLSLAPPRGNFGRHEVIGRDILFTQAGFDATGTLSVGATADSAYTDARPVVQRRPRVGLPGPFTPVAAADRATAVSTFDAHPVVFYGTREGSILRLGHN